MRLFSETAAGLLDDIANQAQDASAASPPPWPRPPLRTGRRPPALIGDLHRFKADYLKAMAHPVRIRALEILRQGEATVGDLGGHVGPEVGNLSQHLAVLRRAGIVDARKSGLSVLYSVRDPEVFAVLDALRVVFSHRVDSMQTVLAADEAPGGSEGVPAGPDGAGRGGS